LNDHEELITAADRHSALPLTHALSSAGGDEAPALAPPPRPALGSPEIRRRVKLSRNPDILLAAMLDECHFLMREVVTESALRAETVQDRLSFVHSALSCARTGAKVGKEIAAIQAMPMSVDRANAITLELARLDRESDS
jgi:hypothetical protein